MAGATGALLAAAGLSVATPIVVQPGTTAGYLYFPKATQAEEMLKAELAKLRADFEELKVRPAAKHDDSALRAGSENLFLDQLRREGVRVLIYQGDLASAARLAGWIESFDEHVVLLKDHPGQGSSTSRMIYNHAISLIVPDGPGFRFQVQRD